MRKIFFTAAAACILIIQTGCFGEFALVRKVYEWNDDLSDSGFVKTLVFYALTFIPVYQIAGFLDIVIFNLIEFWSGDNPIAMEEGDIDQREMTIDGQDYLVTATKNKMSFAKITDGQTVDMGAMIFSESEKSWSFVKGDESVTLVDINDKLNNVAFYTADGVKTYPMEAMEQVLTVDEFNGGGFAMK